MNDLIDPDTFMDFVPIMAEGTHEQITAWMSANVTTRAREAQFFETLPRVNATTSLILTGERKANDDEFWGVVEDGSGKGTQAGLQAAQMVVAALNEDDAALTGIVKAVLESPDEHRIEIAAHLIHATRFVIHDLVAKNKTTPTGVEGDNRG